MARTRSRRKRRFRLRHLVLLAAVAFFGAPIWLALGLMFVLYLIAYAKLVLVVGTLVLAVYTVHSLLRALRTASALQDLS